MNNMKVLDTNYKVKYVKISDEDFLDKYGDVDFEKKVIRVVDNQFKKETLVHELVHATLFTLGFEEKAQDEEAVNIITRIVLIIMKLVR